MNERETRDFMSVEAFSQLPFIRSSPVKAEKSCSSAAIRLFGIDFTNEQPADTSSSSSSHKDDKNNPSNKDASSNTDGQSNVSSCAEANRKFECHYCCRNFPTSQALGGHQNAHKRERQHAKRAHLQCAMAAANHQSLADGAHVYGLFNYHRLGSIPRFGHAYDPLPNYPSWGASANFPSPRFFGSPPQTSTGSPLPGVWRLPPAQSPLPSPLQHQEPSVPFPFYAGTHDPRLLFGGATGPSNASPAPRETVAAANAAAKDQHLSLDLHL